MLRRVIKAIPYGTVVISVGMVVGVSQVVKDKSPENFVLFMVIIVVLSILALLVGTMSNLRSK